MVLLILSQLQSGWPQQPSRRERAPARPKPAKQRGPTPREKYGLQKLSQLSPSQPKQPAPVVIRPPRQDAKQLYEELTSSPWQASPRRKLFPDSPDTTPGLQRKVCAQITHAKHWQVLYHKVVPRYLRVFNSFSAGVFFRRLPAMQPDAGRSPTYAEDREQYEQMLQAVYAVLAPQLHTYTPATLFSIILGMAQVNVPSSNFLALWEQQALQALPIWAPWQLPAVMRALAIMDHVPQQQWLQGLYQAAQQAWQQLAASEMVALASALASLRQQPPEEWMEQLCAALQTRLGDELDGRADVKSAPAGGMPWVLDGTASDDLPPGRVPSAASMMPGLEVELSAGSQMPAQAPTAGVLARAEASAEDLLQPAALQRHAASLLAELFRALGALGFLPDDAWLAWACQLLQEVVAAGSCSAADLVNLLDAWAELGLATDQGLLDALYAELGAGQLAALDAGQLCRLCQVLPQLPQLPSPGWLVSWHRALAAVMPVMSAAQLSTCVRAVHLLKEQQAPADGWVSALCLVTKGRLTEFTAEELVGLLAAAAQMHVPVSPLWVGAVVQHAARAAAVQEGSWDANLVQSLLLVVQQLSTDVQYIRYSHGDDLLQLQALAEAG